MIIPKVQELFDIYDQLYNSSSSLDSFGSSMKDALTILSGINSANGYYESAWQDKVRDQISESFENINKSIEESQQLSDFIVEASNHITTMVECVTEYVDCYKDYEEHLSNRPTNETEEVSYEQDGETLYRTQKTKEFEAWEKNDATFMKTVLLLEGQANLSVTNVKVYFSAYDSKTNLIDFSVVGSINKIEMLTYKDLYLKLVANQQSFGKYGDATEELLDFIKNNYANYSVYFNNAKSILEVDGAAFIQYAMKNGASDIVSNMILNNLMNIAAIDGQVSNSGCFKDYSDFQNIALANLSFLEYLYSDGSVLTDKTINELFIESLSGTNGFELNEYSQFMFDPNTIVDMSIYTDNPNYRNLLLGKLVSYGFGDLKIKELTKGSNGYDVVVVEDKNKEIMVYFPCTNVAEVEDLIFDAYPMMRSVEDNTVLGYIDPLRPSNAIAGIFLSQQDQALDTVNKYLNSGAKVNIGGASLGGNLAEYAYVCTYDENNSNQGDLVLFNSYHTDNNFYYDDINNVFNSAFDRGLLKSYSTEGDVVSNIFNYDSFKNKTIPVYANYQETIRECKEIASSASSSINSISNSTKTKMFNTVIEAYDRITGGNPMFGLGRDALITLRDVPLNSSEFNNVCTTLVDTFNTYNPTVSFYKLLGIDIGFDTNMIRDIQYLEVPFTGVHMPYSVDMNKDVSFDEHGNVLTVVDGHNVENIPANETLKEIFDSYGWECVSDYMFDIAN